MTEAPRLEVYCHGMGAEQVGEVQEVVAGCGFLPAVGPDEAYRPDGTTPDPGRSLEGCMDALREAFPEADVSLDESESGGDGEEANHAVHVDAGTGETRRISAARWDELSAWREDVLSNRVGERASGERKG